MENEKHKKVLLKISETNNFNRNETFTKTDRRRVSGQISKTKNSSILPQSATNSPMSWYIPSEPSYRSVSNDSELKEDVRPPAQSSQASQANIRANSVSNQSFGWNRYQDKSKNKNFSQMYPPTPASQDSNLPASQCRGIQTGRTPLQMYLRKVDYITILLDTIEYSLSLTCDI